MYILETKSLLLISLFVGLVGCRTYQPLELSYDSSLDSVQESNRKQSEKFSQIKALDFASLAYLMGGNSSELTVLRNEYKIAKETSELETPWPNPSVSVGLKKGFDLGDVSEKTTQPFVGLGFTVPIGGKLQAADDYNAAVAEQFRTKLITQHRNLYLRLREGYLNLLLTRHALTVMDSTLKITEKLNQNSQRLIKMGVIGRLGLIDSDFDLKSIRLQALEKEQAYLLALKELAILVGVNQSVIHKVVDELPLPNRVVLPNSEVLLKLIGENNLQLAEWRGLFMVADANLKQQLTKQYPDLSFGVDGEKEPGSKASFFSLSLGFDIPIFDRNQQGIKAAEGERALIAQQYKDQVKDLLIELSQLKGSFKNSRAQLINMNELVLLSEKRLATAKYSLKAGEIDTVEYLDLKKEHDLLLIDQVSKLSEFWQVTFALEQLIGQPLVVLNNENFKVENFNLTEEKGMNTNDK